MPTTGLELRCPIKECDTVTWTSTAAVTRGQLLKIETAVYIVVETVLTADIGKLITLILRAPKVVVDCAIAATGAYLLGDDVYYDSADNEVNESSSGNTLCGTVNEPAAVGDEIVEISFDGKMGV